MNIKEITNYYTIKRTFLFFDEWLFYYVLYKLYREKYYRMWLPVMLYGLSCIYTSYKNIDKIEKRILPIDQIVWLTNKSPGELLKVWFITVRKFILANKKLNKLNNMS